MSVPKYSMKAAQVLWAEAGPLFAAKVPFDFGSHLVSKTSLKQT